MRLPPLRERFSAPHLKTPSRGGEGETSRGWELRAGVGGRAGGRGGNTAVCSSEGREKLGHTLGIKVGAQYIGSTSRFTSPRVDSWNHERARSNAGFVWDGFPPD